MRQFAQEFRTLRYVTDTGNRFLLFAHRRPDPDTVGANVALAEYLRSRGKKVDIACFDPYPEALRPLSDWEFVHPDSLDCASYDAVIASDSVDRGFNEIASRFQEHQVQALIDHHPDISLEGDVTIIDAEYSSSCELVYLFLVSCDAQINKDIATMLLTGLLFDTGGFQHSNVSPRVMEIAALLLKKGAPLAKISRIIFTNKNIAALRLWGKAFGKARLHPENGMLVTAVTKKDVAECQASVEDIYQVTSILSAVPDAKFALVLSERDNGVVRASLRSLAHHGVDVSAIAHQFGGGGHRLASGFEVPGRIVETDRGFFVE